jgi:hypothetical protein
MYHCKECGRRIWASAEKNDPVHVLSRRGTLCTECLRKPEPQKAERQPSAHRAKFGQAAKERWAALPDEEKQARLATMRAGRARSEPIAEAVA